MPCSRFGRRAVAALLLALGGSLPALPQTILRVDDDALAGGDGSSWTSAYRDLQDAIQAAIPLAVGGPVELWVAQGVYRPDLGTGARTSRFELHDNIAIYGGFFGLETLRSQRDADPLNFATVLTGDLLGNDGANFSNRSDNCHNVVYALAVNETAVLDGFYVRGGYADVEAEFGAPSQNGGGLYLKNAAATIADCAFEDNWVLATGGGAFVLADFGTAAPLFEGCRFTSNAARHGGGIGSDQSVGSTASATLIDCAIELNTASFAGGGVHGAGGFTQTLIGGNLAPTGGGLYAIGGALTMFDCDVSGNTATTGTGGGLSILRPQSGAEAYLAGVRVENNGAATDGGGLYTTFDVTMAECQFRGNSAGDQGGAIALDAYVQPNGEHAVVSAFADTIIIDGNDAARGGGVGVLHSAQPRLQGCKLHNNMATQRGGAIETDRQGSVFAPEVHAGGCDFRWNAAPLGGAVYNHAASTYLRCDFVHNHALSNGGAVYAIQVFAPLFAYCRFHGNVANGHGGGVYNINSDVFLDNCELVGNRAGGDGGGLSGVSTLGTKLRGCTVTGNVSGGAFGGGVHDPGPNLRVSNSILYGNSPDGIFAAGGTFSGLAHYSCIGGGAPGAGVFDSHPHFARMPFDGGDGWGDAAATPDFDESVNDDFGDLTVQANSPCIDAADNGSVPADILDADADTDTSEPLPQDMLGETRFHEDPGAPNVGIGPPPIADVGAYEFQRTSRLPGDANCDGRADFFDVDPFLLALFDYAAYVATYSACTVNADVNGDGDVNFFDIDGFVDIIIP